MKVKKNTPRSVQLPLKVVVMICIYAAGGITEWRTDSEEDSNVSNSSIV